MAKSIHFVSIGCKQIRYNTDAHGQGCAVSLANMKTWYEKARDHMDRQGIKVKDVADAIGMTPGGAGHYLSGRRHPKPGMLRKISSRIGVSVSELIEDDPSFARDDFEHQVLEFARDIPEDRRDAAMAMLKALALIPPTSQETEDDSQ